MEEKIIVIILMIVMILSPVILSIPKYVNEETIEIVVKDKYVKNGGESGKYLVATQNGDTFQITDLLFKWKFNSTDLYNQLEIGKTYKVKVTGVRNHFFSWYRNINEILED